MKNTNYKKQLLASSLMLLASAPVFAFDILPAQPGANTTYRLTDVYTLPGGQQRSVSLNPAGVEELILGGTTSFLATVQAEFPTWTFTSASSDLNGSFNVQSYYACGTGTTDCGTERGVPGTVIGNFIDITYTAGAGDPTEAGNDLHWIQRIASNHALGPGGGPGVNVDKVDNDSGDTEPVLGDCDDVPYYDCGYFAGETFFVDRPSRTSDPAGDKIWTAELYLVEQTAAETVTIYNGVRWGWVSTNSDVRALTAPPSSIRFENSTPAVGGSTVATGIGTNDLTWGTAVAGSSPSSLDISPNTFDLTPLIGEPFVLGTITYSNGTIQGGSGIDSIDLIVETSIDVPDMGITDLVIEDTRLISMINTVNTCNALVPGDCSASELNESADYVSLPPAPDLVDVPGTFPTFAELGNNFHVHEESSATATLIGRITEVTIDDANSGNGLLPPGPGAPAPGVSAQPRLVWEILGYGEVIEGDGFITVGQPGVSVDDGGDVDIDIDIDFGGPGGGVVTIGQGNDGLGRNDALILDRLVAIMQENPKTTITINGHADASGSASKDQARSLKYAQQVRDYLLKRRIAKNRIGVEAFGSSQPVASQESKMGRMSNRRIELKLNHPGKASKGPSFDEQLQTVMKNYPAVAEYIIESDAALDVYSSIDLLDGDLLDVVQLDPEASRRLQDSIRLSKCRNSGLSDCYRAECTTVNERDCDLDCEFKRGVERAVCDFQEQQCRAQDRLSCQFVRER